MGFIKEFKEFALKGNVMDMAIGVIIGGAFGKIVTSLVNDLLMPLIGALIGNVIQVTIDFLIVALWIFGVIKLINKATNLVKKQEEEAPAPAPEPSAEEKLLTEIRDLLKTK